MFSLLASLHSTQIKMLYPNNPFYIAIHTHIMYCAKKKMFNMSVLGYFKLMLQHYA